jgi:hypothetical protein
MKILDIPQAGKIGRQVTASNRSGQYHRQLVIPANPCTQTQIGVRHTFGAIAARWRTLTQDQRNAWTATAQTTNSVPRLGQSGPLTGSQLFTRINCSRVALGADPLDNPPAPPHFPANPVGVLVITNLGGVITLKLACPNPPAQHTTVRAAAPCSQGIHYSDHYRILGVLSAPVQGFCDITHLYQACYGSPPIGTKVFIRVNQNLDGWQDLLRETSAIVPPAA